MKFLLMIRGEERWAQLSPAEMQATIEKYKAWAGKLHAEGRLVDAEGLTREGVLFRPEGDRLHVIDGPFAETKELVGGYYAYTAASLAEATEIANECPALGYGAEVELRAVME
jgi:hypothetical protein